MASEQNESTADSPLSMVFEMTTLATDNLSTTSHGTFESFKNDNQKKRRRAKSDDARADHDDHLGDLDEALLARIVSYLPIVDAVRTLTLKQFGNLWASSLESLVFDSREVHFENDQNNQQFTNFVTGVLNRYERTQIQKFELKFTSPLYFKPPQVDGDINERIFLKQRTEETLDSWIEWAVKKEVKVLDMGILKPTNPTQIEFYYEFPEEFLISPSIEELHLSNVGLGAIGGVEHLHLVNLKFMSLTGVTLDRIHTIINGCPAMERLELIKCFWVRRINCSSRNLKTLTVDLGEELMSRPVKISGPNLVELHLAGRIGSFKLVNVSSLRKVETNFAAGLRRSYQIRSHNKLLRTLEKLKIPYSDSRL